MNESREIRGAVVHPPNPVADAAGSIHDDAVARKLGFKGGTIPGDALMDLYAAFLERELGRAWFERGSLSLMFRQALEDGDPVRPILGMHSEGGQHHTRLEAPDGTLIADGTVAVGETSEPTALHARDLRACEPSELRILRNIVPGAPTEEHRVTLSLEGQQHRLERGFGSVPLVREGADWHSESSPWGAAIALPSTAIGELLYLGPRNALRPDIGDSVGLFGAIELALINGPILLDRDYRVRAQVVSVGQSPKTEYLWFDSVASTLEGDTPVATMRMMLRFMKASSPLYAD